MKSKTRCRFIFLAALLASLSTTRAQDIWTGASGGEWNTVGNWGLGTAPGSGVVAVIPSGITANYNLAMSAPSFGILTNNGTLNINAAGFNNTGIFMLTAAGGTLAVNNGGVVNVTGNLAYSSNALVTLAAGGSLTVNGSVLIGAGSTGTTSSSTPGSFGKMTISGGTFAANATGVNSANASVTTSCLLTITGGTANLGTLTIKRSNAGSSAYSTLGTEGVVINGGIVTMTNANIGGAGGNSFLTLWMESGVATNFGTVSINQGTSARGSRLLQTGGLFVVPSPGVINPNPTQTGSLNAFGITGGTNLTGGFYFGNSNTADGGTVLFTNSAAIYVGSQGIASNGTIILNTFLNNGAMFGATANWTNSAALNLTGGTFMFNPSDLNGNPFTIASTGVLSGAGGVLVTNAGTLLLAATNTYTGGTTINPGASLQLGDGLARNGVVVGNITNNGTLIAANATNQTIVSNIFGSGALVVTGPGTLILGTNAYTGGTTISGGTLQLGDGATFNGAIPGDITNNATFAVANATAQILTNLVTGSGGLTKTGATVLTIATNETYTGATTVNAGSLVVAPGSSITSTQSVTIASGALMDVSASTLGGYTLGSGCVFTAGHLTGTGPDFNGNLTNFGTINVPASSIFTLNGNLTLQNGGTNIFNLGSTAGSGSTIALNGGVLNLSGTTTIQINFSLLGVGTYPLISGAGSISGALGNLTLALNGSLGTETAAVQLTATGVNLVVTGSPHNLVWLGDGSANSWDNNSANTDWSNTVTQLPDAFATGYYATFNDTGAVNNQVQLNAVLSPAWTTINGTTSYTFSGSGSINSGSLTNNGTGTLHVQAANTYSGGTAINAGTVEVDTGGALGTGPILDNASLTFNRADAGTNASAITGTGTLTMENGGVETLSAVNTYSGGTTVASGTLRLGAVNAVPGGATPGDVAINGMLDLSGFNETLNGLSGSGTVDTLAGGTPTLTVGANGDSGNFSGIIQNTTGTLNLTKAGTGTETLAHANTYDGATTILNGTLALAVNNALPVGTTITLGSATTSGALDLGGFSQPLAGLAIGAGANGTNQIIGNSSTTSPATLIFTNGGTSTFGGTIQDVLGAGTETVALTVNGGSLVLNGTNAYSGATTINSGGNSMLTVSGGSTKGSSLTMNSANASKGFLLSGGTASFNGPVIFSADNGDNANYMEMTGGIFNAGSFALGRTSLSFTAMPATGQATSLGVYVNNNAVVNITNTLQVGGYNPGANSSSSLRLDGASRVNVGGTTTITINNGSRWSILDVNGGTFTSTDATGAGIQIGGVYSGANAELFIRGGTVSADTLTFGDSIQTGGTDIMILTNATLYLGAGGIVSGNSAPSYTETISLGSATLGALANWSSSLPMPMTGVINFQAADANNNPLNIALNGSLSGSGTLNKTGGGVLTLGAMDTYTGGTFINAGTLALGSGGSVASLNILVGSNAFFDVSQVGGGFILTANQSIKGFGMVNGAVTAASGAIIYPGSNALTGTLTFAGNLTENGGVNNTFNLSTNPAGPLNDLLNAPGGLTVSGQNSIIINGSVQAGGVYPIISYAGGSFNGSLANFTVTGASGALSNSTTAQTIYFVAQSAVRGPTNVTWLGNATNNNWDTEMSANWLNAGTALPDIFVPGDNALFSNLGATNPLINLAGTVTPASIVVNTTSNYTFTGAGSIGGATGLSVSNGTLAVLTTNSYTGQTIVSGGTLAVNVLGPSGSPSSLGAASADPTNLILNGGILAYDGPSAATDHNITLTNAGGALDVAGGIVLTLNGTLSGNGQFTKTDSGTLVLATANSLTNTNTISGGVLQINNAGGLGSGPIIFTNGALAYNPSAGLTVANPFNFATNTTNSLIITSGSGANPISSGPWSGGGLLIVSNSFNPFTLNGNLDSFTGIILLSTANAAALRFNSGGGNTTFGSTNATFDLGTGNGALTARNSGTMNLGGLAGGSGTSLVGQGAGSGTVVWNIGNNNQSTVFAGTIKNNAANQISAVTKIGSGTLTLAGQNTYTGPTAITSGILALDYNTNSSSDGSILGSTSVTVGTGAVLDVSGRSDATFPLAFGQTLEGSGTILGILDASGTVAPGGGPTGNIGTLSVTNTIILESSSTAIMKLNRISTPSSDQIVSTLAGINFGGTLVATNVGPALQVGDTFALFSGAALNGSFASLVLSTNIPSGAFWDTSRLASNGVISVSAPAIGAVDFSQLSGGSITLNAIGAPNGTVVILSTTNLTLSITNWTPILTNTFDANGNLNTAIPVPPSAQQEYFTIEGF